MKNPLNRRIFRELKTDFGKYFVIFMFMIVTIGFVSGDLVASDSMMQSLESRFEQDQIEDGHFLLAHEASDELIAQIEKESVTVYKDYYAECSYPGDNGTEKKLRIFRDRSRINKACIMEGRLPTKQGDIAIDRMYADNNELSPGDRLTLKGQEYTICGLVSLGDYTAMFESNSETMFDALNFCVALITPADFDSLFNSSVRYNYSWRYNGGTPASDEIEKDQADALSEAIVKGILKEEGGSEFALAVGILSLGNELEEFIPRYANQAIWFAREDIGRDSNMMLVFLYILITIMAFIFGVTTSHTITKESPVIGTLRASGYTRGELFRQYISMPILVTLLSALIGNILGYTLFKYVIEDLYYNSYSLPTYVTVWNSQAFILTTVIPLLVMIGITGITLIRNLKYSPLAFIRRQLGRKKQKRGVRLPDFGFFTRFRIRIILQNKANYLTLFFGILISTVLLLFGLMLPPLLEDVSHTAVASMVADYQYIVAEDARTDNPSAERIAVTSMKSHAGGYNEEDILLYGIYDDSQYIHEKLPEKGALISTGYADKYRLKPGDSFILRVPFENKLYELKVAGLFPAPTTLNVYLSHDNYCEMLDVDKDFFNGYLSNQELTDLGENQIYSCITEHDMRKLSEQLSHSMGELFNLFYIFAILLFVLVVYLLTKIILERNATSISMVKILGYENREISQLYLIATFWMMVLSVLVSYGIVSVLLDSIFILVMKDFSGWIPFHIDFSIYVEAFALTIGAYLVVSFIQMHRIKKIPMDTALKNVE